MGIVAGIGGTAGAIALGIAFVLWLLGHTGDDGGNPHPDDPDAPDENGFIPADKYGYGYGYSWGDPYGDNERTS